jgi:hypothetical protein
MTSVVNQTVPAPVAQVEPYQRPTMTLHLRCSRDIVTSPASYIKDGPKEIVRACGTEAEFTAHTLTEAADLAVEAGWRVDRVHTEEVDGDLSGLGSMGAMRPAGWKLVQKTFLLAHAPHLRGDICPTCAADHAGDDDEDDE